MIENVIGMSDI